MIGDSGTFGITTTGSLHYWRYTWDVGTGIGVTDLRSLHASGFDDDGKFCGLDGQGSVRCPQAPSRNSVEAGYTDFANGHQICARRPDERVECWGSLYGPWSSQPTLAP